MLIFTAIFAIYFIAINAIAYRAFANDKKDATEKLRRTPEAELLHWAAIGGWIGAKYAQQKLRHKSYKQPFGEQLNDIGRGYAVLLGTCALAGFVVLLAPAQGTTKQFAKARLQVRQPASAPPHLSLRPPATRHASLRPPAARPVTP